MASWVVYSTRSTISAVGTRARLTVGFVQLQDNIYVVIDNTVKLINGNSSSSDKIPKSIKALITFCTVVSCVTFGESLILLIFLQSKVVKVHQK